MWAALLAGNLSVILQALTGLGHGGRAHATRLRHQLLCVPARVITHARGLTLRLPPGHQLLPAVLARLRALPQPGPDHRHPTARETTGTRPPGAHPGQPPAPPRNAAHQKIKPVTAPQDQPLPADPGQSNHEVIGASRDNCSEVLRPSAADNSRSEAVRPLERRSSESLPQTT